MRTKEGSPSADHPSERDAPASCRRTSNYYTRRRHMTRRAQQPRPRGIAATPWLRLARMGDGFRGGLRWRSFSLEASQIGSSTT